MKTLRLCITFALFLFAFQAHSQEIHVIDAFHIDNDLAARTSPRRSPDGSYCALLRINLPTASKIDFEDIIGESDYSPGEYTVYVPAHTTRLLFNVPGYQEGVIDFTSLGLDLDEKETYRVTMAFPRSSEDVGNLRILSDHGGQIVFVDGIPIGETPVVAEGLSVGHHIVSVANTNGFTCDDVTVAISKGVTSEIRLSMSAQVTMPFGLAFSSAPDTGDEHPLRKVTTSFNGKVGLKDYSGKLLVPCEFDDISIYNLTLDSVDEDYYVVLNDAKYGIYKPGQGLVVPCIYDKIYHPGELLAVESSEGNKSFYRYINSDGVVLTDVAYPYVQLWPKELPALVRTDRSQYGFVNDKGQICIPPQYQSASVFQEGFALVRKTEADYVVDRLGNETRLTDGYEIDFKRRMRIEDGLIHEGLFIVKNKATGKYGYANVNGKVVIDGKFDDVSSFNDGYANVRLGQDRFLCSKSGDLIAQDRNRDQLYRYILERRDGKYGLLLDGKALLDFEYDRIEIETSHFYSETVISAVKDGEKSLYDKDLKLLFVVPEEVTVMSMHKGIVSLQDTETYKIGFFRSNGEVIIPCICDIDPLIGVGDQSFDMVSNGFAMVEIGDRRGFVSKGGIVLPFDYIASLPVDKNGHTLVRDKNEVWYDIVFDVNDGTLLRKTQVILPQPKVFPSQQLSKEEYVDLGLKVLWASRNLSSTSPMGTGGYYSFEEALAKDKPQPEDVVYDLATITAGNTGVHLPSSNDFTELEEKCVWEWAIVDGVRGYVISGKTPGYEDKRIFLPASGWNGGFASREVGEEGHYWTSSIAFGAMLRVRRITSDSIGYSFGDADSPKYSIRAVKEKAGGGPLEEAKVQSANSTPSVTIVMPDIEETADENYSKYEDLDDKPLFEGEGLRRFSEWVNSQLEYPASAKEYGIQGRVTLSFVVNSEGKVENVRVQRGVEESLDKEAVRVVTLSPDWTPGKVGGTPVNVLVTFPIIFQLR